MSALILYAPALLLVVVVAVAMQLWIERTNRRGTKAASDYHLIDSGISSGNDGGGGGTVIRVPKDPSQYAKRVAPRNRGERQ